MANKGKLPVKDKITVVETYLSGKMNLVGLSEKYRVHQRTIADWAQIYTTRGPAGLESAIVKKIYPQELKKQVVAEYLNGSESLRNLCLKYDC